MSTNAKRGVTVAQARRMILSLADVAQGRSYGLPSFLLAGKFFVRFRDKDTVLVLQLGTIDDRDVLMRLDPSAFFFTEHYRNYPAVLIRLAEVPRPLLAAVLKDAWRAVVAKRGPRTARKTARASRRR